VKYVCFNICFWDERPAVWCLGTDGSQVPAGSIHFSSTLNLTAVGSSETSVPITTQLGVTFYKNANVMKRSREINISLVMSFKYFVEYNNIVKYFQVICQFYWYENILRTAVLDINKWRASLSSRFTTGSRPSGTHGIAGLLCPWASTESLKNSTRPGIRPRTFDLPVCVLGTAQTELSRILWNLWSEINVKMAKTNF